MPEAYFKSQAFSFAQIACHNIGLAFIYVIERMIKMNDNENNLSVQSALRVIPSVIREKLATALLSHQDTVQDIVLRSQRPVCVYIGRKQMYLTKTGCLTDFLNSQDLVIANVQNVIDCFNTVCGYSVYSHISEIKEGFITISGGHRVGISGTAVLASGQIHNIRDISSVSVRISRQIKNCASQITKEFLKGGGGMLICGSPCSGKTTLLRDMTRLISTDYASRVALVDTRGELAAVSQGVNQNDIGMADVLDGYPRAVAIEQAVRSLSPEYILCDEIGSKDDVQAITHGVNCGVNFVATMHAGSKEELLKRKNIEEILATKAFEKVAFLCGRENPCVVKEICSLGELVSV